MPRCQVCRSKYQREESRCSTCGWDLQPYSLIVGAIPEVFQKEQSKIFWAKDLWNVLIHCREQLSHYQQEFSKTTEAQIQMNQQLTEALQECDLLSEVLKEQVLQFNTLQAEYDQSKQSDSDTAHLIHQPQNAIMHTAPATHPLPDTKADQDQSPVSDSSLLQFQSLTVAEQGHLTYRDQSAPCLSEAIGLTDTLEMIKVPPGSFWMGSPDWEEGREASENSLHWVTVSAFWISRFPITQRQWRTVAESTPINRSLNPDPSMFEGKERPVEQVSWHDAVEFCDRLSQITQQHYRLPSEAEWEYACRAETKTPFHFGHTLSSRWANYDGNYTYGAGIEGSYPQQTTDVGSFQAPNAYGLSDMHGNVWEWCADLWHENYAAAPLDGSPWLIEGRENHRVLRGGSWYCLPALCRSAHRHWDQANHAGSGIGFRVVRSI
jgi:formylglycine-generating enzyme required for sulfatase activity